MDFGIPGVHFWMLSFKDSGHLELLESAVFLAFQEFHDSVIPDFPLSIPEPIPESAESYRNPGIRWYRNAEITGTRISHTLFIGILGSEKSGFPESRSLCWTSVFLDLRDSRSPFRDSRLTDSPKPSSELQNSELVTSWNPGNSWILGVFARFPDFWNSGTLEVSKSLV